MVLEAALFGGADAIVTFEAATFAPICATLRIEVLTPGQALAKLSV
jgi:hypothetical protein